MSDAEFKYIVRDLTAETPLAEYLRDCVDVGKFLNFCRICPNYGHIWSCPPYDFDPMDIWRQYVRLRLYARMLIPKFLEQDAAAAIAALHREKEEYLNQLLNWESAVPGSLALAAGSCSVCAICAKSEDEPCRKPAKMRYSIESLGGDVGLTARRYFGKPLLWIRDGVIPEYLMLVGALLMPAGKEGTAVESLL